MRWTSWMSTLTPSSRCWSSSTLDRCDGHSPVLKILNAFFSTTGGRRELHCGASFGLSVCKLVSLLAESASKPLHKAKGPQTYLARHALGERGPKARIA